MATKTKRRTPAHLTKATKTNGHTKNGHEHVRSGIARAKKRSATQTDHMVEKAHEETYNEWKEFEGQRYTGMKVGSHHKW